MHITQERVKDFGVDASLMRWIAEHLRDYIEIPAEYDEAGKSVSIESYGVLDVGVLTDVMDRILREIEQDPSRLLNDPYVGGRTHHLTTMMVLCGEEPDITDDWLYWFTQRALNTTPAVACQSAPKIYRVCFETKFLGKWGPTTVLLDAEGVEEHGDRWAEMSASSIRNIVVYDGADDVTYTFECFPE